MMLFHVLQIEKKKFGPFGRIYAKQPGINFKMTSQQEKSLMSKILVRSAFKGSSCGVASRKTDTTQFKQIFPAIFADAVSEKKLGSKIETTKIPF